MTGAAQCTVRVLRPCFLDGQARKAGELVRIGALAARDAVTGGRCEFASAGDRSVTAEAVRVHEEQLAAQQAASSWSVRRW